MSFFYSKKAISIVSHVPAMTMTAALDQLWHHPTSIQNISLAQSLNSLVRTKKILISFDTASNTIHKTKEKPADQYRDTIVSSWTNIEATKQSLIIRPYRAY
jgi:hypothetical protein